MEDAIAGVLSAAGAGLDASHTLSSNNRRQPRSVSLSPLTGQDTGSEMLSDQGHLLVTAVTGAQPRLCLNPKFLFLALPLSGLISGWERELLRIPLLSRYV